MSIWKGTSFNEVVQTITPIFQEELGHQKTTNKALTALNAKVDDTIQTILKDPSIKELNPEIIKEISASITEEMTSLVKRTDNLKSLATHLKEAIAYTKRAPLDPTCLETIAYLDPKLADQVTTLFTKAMENHKQLNETYKDLQKLSQEQQNTIKDLQRNIRVLNKTVQGKGWLPTLCEKISHIFKGTPKKHVTFDLNKNTEKLFLKTNPANTPSISINPTEEKPSSLSVDEAKAAEPPINEPTEAKVADKTTSSNPKASTPSTETCKITRGASQAKKDPPSKPTDQPSKKNKISARELKSLGIDPTLDLSAPRTTRSAKRK